MKEFTFSDEERIDPEQFRLVNQNQIPGILHCSRIRCNDRIKLIMITDGFRGIQDCIGEMQPDQLRVFCKKFLQLVEELEKRDDIDMENISWDLESLFVKDEDQSPALIYIPTKLAKDGTKGIYLKRIYALLEEMFKNKENGETVVRQIEFQKEKDFSNWESLRKALDREVPVEDDQITLRSINAPNEIIFEIGHDRFPIGSDPEQASGVIPDPEKISPLHATVGWNDISFYIVDHESREGTFVNQKRVAPGAQIPIGKGSVIQFADLTFNVE